MAIRVGYSSIAVLLGVLLCAFTFTPRAICQSTQSASQVKTIPIEHLYWHFLMYQNFMDGQAVAQIAQGGDGTWLRNHLQIKLGFNDADYAVVRASSERLATEVHALDAQAKANKSAGGTKSQLQELVAQRETAINAEVAYLKQSLPPYKIKIFEAFLTQFFSPSNMKLQPRSVQQTAAVQ